MPTSVPPKGDDFRRSNAHFANLKVYAQDAPDLTVKVSSGGYWIDEKIYVEFSAGSTEALIPPPGSAQWVVIALNEIGGLELIYGDVAPSPTVPELPANRLPLAGVFLAATDLEITSDRVFDLRPLWKVGAQFDSVEITDIINLQNALDDKASNSNLDSLLLGKADVDGTNNNIFTLNKDQTGVSGADAKLVIERGSAPNVDLRWNESSEIWEFTNDGATWNPLGSTTELVDFPLSASGILSIDFNLGSVAEVTLTEDISSMSFTNPPVSGRSGLITLILKQDNIGFRSVTFPTSVKWSLGSPPTITQDPGVTNIFTFMTVDAGTSWYGILVGEDMY